MSVGSHTPENCTHQIIPDSKSAFTSTGFPFSSFPGRMSKTVRMHAMEIHKVASAMKRPGQMLRMKPSATTLDQAHIQIHRRP